MHRNPLFGIVRTRGQNIKLLTSLSFVLIFDKFCPVVFFHDWGGGVSHFHLKQITSLVRFQS